jgi:hypothetical protein
MKTKILLITGMLLMGLGNIDLLSQTKAVEYTYDSTGNCQSRKVITLNSSSILRSSTTDISEIVEDEQIDVKIYPNPTKGLLNIVISGYTENEEFRVSIYDMSGKLYLTTTKKEANIQLDLSSYTKGTYILQMGRNGSYSSWKIIKIN